MKFSSKKEACKINGKKGGRPKQDSSIRIELPDIDLVILARALGVSITDLLKEDDLSL